MIKAVIYLDIAYNGRHKELAGWSNPIKNNPLQDLGVIGSGSEQPLLKLATKSASCLRTKSII